jgi:lantibiotic biosynthesis protein
LPEIHQWVKNLRDRNLINNMVIDTYEPEIERYGGIKVMTKAEDWFATDSLIIAQWLNLKQTNQVQLNKELLAVISIVDLMNQYFSSYEEQLKWLDSIIHYKEFIKEFRKERRLYMDSIQSLNDWKKTRMGESNNLLYNALSVRNGIFNEYMLALRTSKGEGNLTSSQISIFESLIHMHLNRMFGTNRRIERKILAFARHSIKSLIAIEKVRGTSM